MARQFLVTGGAGFIGSHLVDRLLQAGERVTVLDDLSTGRLANLEPWLGRPQLAFVPGSVSDAALLRSAAKGCDVIVHLAAFVSVPLTIQNPEASFHTNALGTFNVFEAARHTSTVRSVIYASSAAVYGPAVCLPIAEDTPPCPLSPYAADKLYAESLARVYAVNYGLNSCGFRFFNVFGPRQDPSSPYSGVISLFLKQLCAGLPVTIYGDGEQTRDFIHVADVVDALLRATDRTSCEANDVARVLNLGRGEQISINALYSLIRNLVGSEQLPIYLEARSGDIRYSQASISSAYEQLQWRPRTGLQDGLEQLCAAFRRHNTLGAT